MQFVKIKNLLFKINFLYKYLKMFFMLWQVLQKNVLLNI